MEPGYVVLFPALEKKASMWKILCLCDKLEVFLDSEHEARDDGKEWKVIAKSSVDLNENESKYGARTNNTYQRHLIERNALARMRFEML